MLENRLVAGAMTGLMAAAVVDIGAFRSWKTVDEAIAYDWRTALWRWFQGAVVGMLAAAGLDAIG